MTALPVRAELLLRQVYVHKQEQRRHREAAREKMAEVEAICNALGIEFRRSPRHGEAQGHGHTDRNEAAS